MARLSHKRVMEIKLTIAKSALRQMMEMAERDVRKVEADILEGVPRGYFEWLKNKEDTSDMFMQFKNLAYFALSDLDLRDEEITGLSHG